MNRRPDESYAKEIRTRPFPPPRRFCFVDNGLGRVNQVQTANLVSGSNQVKSNVTADYSGISYNARNEIDSGDINIDVKAPDQTPVSHAVDFVCRSGSENRSDWRFQGWVLANKTVTDYSNA